MSIDDENDSRAKMDALLTRLARPNRSGKQTRRAKTVEASKAGIEQHNKRHHRQRRQKLKHKAQLAKPAKAIGHRGRSRRAFSLIELLIMRTDGAKWYTFAQLRALLPETTIDGFKGIMFQKAPSLGLVERAAIVDSPEAPWMAGQTPVERYRLANKPKYRYRIGAESGVDRARLREKWSAYGEVADSEENA